MMTVIAYYISWSRQQDQKSLLRTEKRTNLPGVPAE